MSKVRHASLLRRVTGIAGALVALVLGIGTWRDRDFWSTPDQRGDALFRKGKYAEAAKVYADPWRIGTAQYRDGAFEAAARTFARVHGAIGAYDAGNAWLMHGQYDQAIACYDRALGFRPGWKEAQDNKELATARRDRIKAAAEDEKDESADAYDPDEIVMDGKGDDGKPSAKPLEGPMDDATLQATWLRRVTTTPGEFLKAKFAWQARQGSQPQAKEAGP